MVPRDGSTRPSCRECGTLVAKEGCYALRRDDGAEYWLELQRIPMDLIERQVQVEGVRHPANLIEVSSIQRR